MFVFLFYFVIQKALGGCQYESLLLIRLSLPNDTLAIKKTVADTFHQGDPKFGISRVIQCMCNAFFSIGLSDKESKFLEDI